MNRRRFFGQMTSSFDNILFYNIVVMFMLTTKNDRQGNNITRRPHITLTIILYSKSIMIKNKTN